MKSWLLAQIKTEDFNIPEVEADNTAIENVLKLVFAIIGGLSVLMVIIGGVRYIISTGDPQKTATAKNTIIYAIVGLIISVSAFVLVGFIFRVIEGSPA